MVFDLAFHGSWQSLHGVQIWPWIFMNVRMDGYSSPLNPNQNWFVLFTDFAIFGHTLGQSRLGKNFEIRSDYQPLFAPWSSRTKGRVLKNWIRNLSSAKIQLILCFTIMISTRVCNVLLPYYSKLIVDKLTESSLTDSSLNEVTRLVGVLMTLQMLFSSSGLLTQVRSLSIQICPISRPFWQLCQSIAALFR